MTALLKIFAGLCAVILLGAAAFTWSGAPGSAASLEERLRREASALIGDADNWAIVSIDGQKISLSGAAPDAAARDALITRFEARRDSLRGPFLIVEAHALTVVAPPDRLRPAIATAAPDAADDERGVDVTGADPVETLISSLVGSGEQTAADEAAAPEENAPEEVAPIIHAPAESQETPAPEALQLTESVADTPETIIPGAENVNPGDFDAACVDGVLAVAANIEIIFSSDSSTLSDEARATLVPLATLMIDCPAAHLRVTGHTDSSGDTERNIELSRERARAVAGYLVTFGVNPARITNRGVGSREPLADNRTTDGRARNRRIEFDLEAENR